MTCTALLALLCWTPPVHASGDSCAAEYTSTAPSVLADPTIVIHIDAHEVALTVDGCSFTVDDEPLELDFGDLSEVTLVVTFDHPLEGARLLLATGAGTVEIEPEGGRAVYTLTEDAELFITTEGPTEGPDAPTLPIVIRKPSEPNPEPSSS